MKVKPSNSQKYQYSVLTAAALLIGSFGSANASVQIIGYLGNFDVYNRTGSAMEGFEVDLPGLTTNDLMSTYCGSAFQCGTGYNTTGSLGVVYDGNNPSAYASSVADGGITHFGVHVTKWPTGNIAYNWLDRNTTNNQLYIAGTNALAAGQTLPVEIPAVPEPVTQAVVVTPDWSLDGATLSAVVRNTTNRPIWVQGVSAEDVSAVSLDDLMANNALFENLPMAEAQLLDPGDALTEAGDIAASSFGGRAMFWVYDYTGDMMISDTTDAGVNIYNKACVSCDFATMHGTLQSKMMTSVDIGPASVPVPAAMPLFLSALVGMGWIGSRRNTK